jgi:oligoribonuclease
MTYKQKIFWGDIETGGIDGRIENDKLGMLYYPIFEFAIIITGTDLEPIGEPLRIVIHQTEDEIAKCHPWALNQHTKSGLLDEVRASKINLEQAEALILDYLSSFDIEPYCNEKRKGLVFAGNSIKLDRNFVMSYMVKLDKFLHYRQFDISAIALAAKFWNPEIAKEVKKEYKHLALEDIKESIKEAKVYKKVFKQYLAV